MKTVRFHPEAEAEMIDAAVWYESQQATLGKHLFSRDCSRSRGLLSLVELWMQNRR